MRISDWSSDVCSSDLFLPQFVDPGLGAAAWQMIALGAVVIAVALLWETFLIFGAGALSHRLRTQPAIAKWINRASGATFIGLGVKLDRKSTRPTSSH